jgi:hypothetical protein
VVLGRASQTRAVWDDAAVRPRCRSWYPVRSNLGAEDRPEPDPLRPDQHFARSPEGDRRAGDRVGRQTHCDGTRAVGCFWSSALGWPLVWERDQETAIQSPRGGTKVYVERTTIGATWFETPVKRGLCAWSPSIHWLICTGRDHRSSRLDTDSAASCITFVYHGGVCAGVHSVK